jgi:LAS superfamily LD-carboxypeptidase LdcB
LDAISSINARISTIEMHLASVRAGAGVRGGTATASAGSFATTYADALASVRTESGTATVGTGASKLNAKGVPLDLVAYGNGKIPSSALRQVAGTNHQLWAPAADSLTRLISDAKRDGVKIGITDSYRPYTEQVDLAKRKGLYSQGGLAAKPGTSDHGWGMAVDLDLDSKAQAWMRTNGATYGFKEDTPREPWHWAYTPRT